ncbi:MAG: electron transfer flavoprotein subunit alpha [Lachnospiraceae bacterium]|nr:electron transfer flavoprotein subunit alpha [Lachnospiraceae bacterium]
MARIVIDENKCILCGQCVDACPFGALSLTDKVEVSSGCRLCKVCIGVCPVGATDLEEDIVVEGVNKADWNGIMVFVEQQAGKEIHPVALELIGKARSLAGKINHKVSAVIIGDESSKEKAEQLLNYGVDRVYVYAHEELAAFRGDVYANVMEDCIQAEHPSVVLVGATSLGRSLAPMCASRFHTGLTADCTMLDIKDNTDLVQVRPAFGGNIMAQIITTNTRPQFATVRYKVMERAEKCEPHGEIFVREVRPEMLQSGIEVISTETIVRNKSIEEEDVLVVAGRGVKRQEDLQILRDLAEALGGRLCTTRPLVEKGWGDPTEQIGLSGRTVKPKLIITCGVSGAIQFRAGMDGSECIVAINTDQNAPIFNIANYCIVQDLYEFVPKLTAAVRKVKEEEAAR